MKGKLPGFIQVILFIYLGAVFIISVVVSKENKNSKTASRQDIIEYAQRYLTNPFLIEHGKRLDCSGYIWVIYGKFDYDLPKTAAAQQKHTKCQLQDILPGDLVFFSETGNKISHVGLLLNDNIFIHSPGKNKPVCLDSLNSTYWKDKLRGAGRVIR